MGFNDLSPAAAPAIDAADGRIFRPLEHDPEKWKPVFRKDHAQTKG
jgi:hypothetical protein